MSERGGPLAQEHIYNYRSGWRQRTSLYIFASIIVVILLMAFCYARRARQMEEMAKHLQKTKPATERRR
jgi:hypothetical protein